MFRLHSKRAFMYFYFPKFHNSSKSNGISWTNNEYLLDFKTFAILNIDPSKSAIKNALIKPPPDLHLPYSAYNNTNTTQMAQEVFQFEKNHKMLTEGLPYSTINVNQLIYLPLTTINVKRQEIFLDQLLIPWWKAFEPFIRSNRVPTPNLVKGTFFGLRKIDEATNGRLSKLLGPYPIAMMTDYALNSVLTLSPKNFDLFMYSLYSFTVYGGIDKDKNKELIKKLSKIFPKYISASLTDRLPFAHHMTKHASKIMFRLQNIGVEKPSERHLGDLITMFGKVVDEMEYSSHLQYLSDLHFVAIVLIRWSIDADRYDAIFWSNWYKKMSKYYSALSQSSGFFNAMFLTDWLLVALKFDKEKEFLKNLPLWLDGFRLNRNYIYPDNLEFLIEKTKQKYLDDELGRMDEMVLTKILNVLERKYR